MKIETVGPTYSEAPLRRTHEPPRFSGQYEAHLRYRDCLRLEFAFRCTYCLSLEVEVGPGEAFGGFEVDHFRPTSRQDFYKLRNTYANLFWSCHACNRAKGNRWPTDAQQAQGSRFVDPAIDSLADHLSLRNDQVFPTNDSRAGAYTIRQINLNSNLQKTRRRNRDESRTKLAVLEDLLEAQRATLAATPEAQEIHATIESLLRKIGVRSAPDAVQPWDAPADCACTRPQPIKPARKLTRRERMKAKAEAARFALRRSQRKVGPGTLDKGKVRAAPY